MIKGMRYLSSFIDEDEEQSLISLIDSNEWCNDLKRRTQHYGYKYDYSKKKIDASMYLGNIPDWLDKYCTLLLKKGIFEKKPDQVIINEYLPGQGISRHVDCVACFGDTVASLSLGSTCSMVFDNLKLTLTGETILGPGSLLVLSNEARYDWMHSIPARLEDENGDVVLKRSRRISLTFRTVKL